MTEQNSRIKPEWAKAAIVAEYQINDSDPMTDYFATERGREVFLGWSKSARVSFAELRKAAAMFGPTANLGPGRDKYTIRVVFTNDVVYGGQAYWPGESSHWHHAPEFGHDREFATLAEAEAFIAAAPTPHPIGFGGQEARFGYRIDRESYERRERYSMGRGLVLGADSYRTGWTVRKIETGGYGFRDVEQMAGPDDQEVVA